MRIVVNEQAERISIFTLKAGFSAESLFCHCSYLLVYNSSELDHHWKNEIFGIVKPLKRPRMKSGDKYEALQEALVEDEHGVHFCEDKENIPAVLHRVYDSEEIPHAFYYNMDLKRNQAIYINALDKFYYEFLLKWLAVPDPDPQRKELDEALDKYLISRRKEMASA